MDEQTKGRIVSTVVPGTFLLGTKLGDWYEKNPYHRFNDGDILILKWRNILGHGIRPVAVVNDYRIKEDKFVYDITMYRDEEGDILQWIKENKVPQGVERTVSEHEIHFKWNIENRFKKVSVKTIDEALALYASRKVEQKKE